MLCFVYISFTYSLILIAWNQCQSSACLNCRRKSPIFPTYWILAQKTCSVAPLIHFTTAVDPHKKTSAWEKQLTDGGGYYIGHVCFNTDPGIHVLPPFMFWTPLHYYKRRLKSKGEEWGEKRRELKRHRERRMKRNAGLASGSVLWCKRNRESERKKERRVGGEMVFGSQCVFAHGHLYV